ncbi:hypothetical protein [Clavibacter tessellarius]|uniref:hypothetical protein n=1 Tax=Clavibacter tessellarius TaxID=31965 RepID=UPI003251FF1A
MTAAVEGLTVTEGGGTAVETDDLTRIAARLDDEAGRLDDHARALALPPLVATITGDHDASLDAPRGLLSSAAHDARALAADLRRVAAEYADGERDVDRCVRSAAGDGAADAAPSSPGGPLRILLPAVVRDVVSDIAAAATRFLPARPAGDDGVRETAAGLLAALGAFGVLRDAPAMVHVRRDAVRPAPASLQDLADRIPDPVPGTPQMRVEEYRVPDGRRRFVAYFGGMVTMDPGTGREDFGPASAAAALATEGGSAVHAAETALRESGATAEDEVYVVGYSMGGILARSVGDDLGFHVTHEPHVRLPGRAAADPPGDRRRGGGAHGRPRPGARRRAPVRWRRGRRRRGAHAGLRADGACGRPGRARSGHLSGDGDRDGGLPLAAPGADARRASTGSSTGRRRSRPTSTGRSGPRSPRPADRAVGCDARVRPSRSPGAARGPPAS